MIVVRPIEIGVSDLTSSVAIDDHDEWAVGTTYAEGAEVVHEINIYESLEDGNIGNNPATTSTGEEPKWLDLGRVNRWRMFDEFVGSYTEDEDEIIVTLDIHDTDYVALLELDAATLQVEILDSGDASLWSVDFDLLDGALEIGDWYEYFYAPYPAAGQRDVVVPLAWMLTELTGEKLRVTLGGGGTIKCGKCIPGMAVNIGQTQWKPEIGAIDYSRKLTDDFGRTYLKKGRFAKIIRGDLIVPTGGEGFVVRALNELLGQACVFDFNEPGTTYDPLVVYGFIQDYRQTIHFTTFTTLSLDIQGLI